MDSPRSLMPVPLLRGRGKRFAGAGPIQYAYPNESAMHGLVVAVATRNKRRFAKQPAILLHGHDAERTGLTDYP